MSSGITTSSESTSARAAARLPWIVFGALTATQVGIGVWRAVVLFRGGLSAGVRPLEWSPWLGIEVATCLALAAVAWWWLPVDAPRERSAAAWGVRFLLCAWLLTLAHYLWGLTGGRLLASLTWIVIAALFAVGWWVRQRRSDSDAIDASSLPAQAPPASRIAFVIAAVFFAAYVPHLIFNYGFTDAKLTWACRAFKIAERDSLTGILECLNPAHAPLHGLTLWLGIRDPVFQGRLLPLLMFGAFVLVFYGLLRRAAPRLAPWGVVWLVATDHVFKGQVSSYSGLPEMLAIVLGLAVVIDPRGLAPTRGFGLLLAIVAGAVVALTRRDGFPEFLVAGAVLIVVTRRWTDARAWAIVGAACVAYLSWAFRPDVLQAMPAFPPRLGSAGVVYQVADSMGAPRRLWMLLYGAQGQLLSHYGYGAFAWSWLIAGVWARSIKMEILPLNRAALYGLAGLVGWAATLAAYAALTFLGHAYMSSLFVVRTGFGRHLVHFFPLCLLHATALAERVLTKSS